MDTRDASSDHRSTRRRVATRFMTVSQRPRRSLLSPRRMLAVVGVKAYAIASLDTIARNVETIPCRAPEGGRRCDTRRSRRDASELGREQSPLHERRQPTKPVEAEGRTGPEWRARLQREMPAPTTGYTRTAGDRRASRHMDHSTADGQVSKAPASHTPAQSAQVSVRRRARRGCWTFMLGTCRTDFPRFGCLPSSMRTGTSVRASLGSRQGEQAPTLTSLIRRRGAGRLMQSGSRQSGLVLSRVSVSKLGRTSYIGAGEARPTLDGGGLEEAAPDSQYPRRRHRPFTATVRDRHERREPMSPHREELGARWI